MVSPSTNGTWSTDRGGALKDFASASTRLLPQVAGAAIVGAFRPDRRRHRPAHARRDRSRSHLEHARGDARSQPLLARGARAASAARRAGAARIRIRYMTQPKVTAADFRAVRKPAEGVCRSPICAISPTACAQAFGLKGTPAAFHVAYVQLTLTRIRVARSDVRHHRSTNISPRPSATSRRSTT